MSKPPPCPPTPHREKQLVSVKAPDVLGIARQHMLDRAATYDKPEGERSMAQTVAVFNLYHGTKLTEAQGWHFQQILKDVRLFTRAGYHADSAEDCVAYAALKAEAKAGEAKSGMERLAADLEGVPYKSVMKINDIDTPNPEWADSHDARKAQAMLYGHCKARHTMDLCDDCLGLGSCQGAKGVKIKIT